MATDSLLQKRGERMGDTFSIKQVSERTGLTEDAIRYYEKIGLLPSPKRKDNRHRVYHIEDAEMMELITCLKKTGMPVIVAENPLDCVAIGTGKALENIHLFKSRSSSAVRSKR